MNSALSTNNYPTQVLTRDALEVANTDVIVPRSSNSFAAIPLLVIVLQILDGLLTITGTITFGVTAEGNPILRQLISQLGVIPAILTTKLGCISVVILLWTQAARILWLPTALCLVAAVYTVCAVLPWSLLLISNYFC